MFYLEKFLPRDLANIVAEYDSDPFRRFETCFGDRSDVNMMEFKKYSDDVERLNIRVKKSLHDVTIKITNISIELVIQNNLYIIDPPDFEVLRSEIVREVLGHLPYNIIHLEYGELALYFYLWKDYKPVDKSPKIESLEQYLESYRDRASLIARALNFMRISEGAAGLHFTT